MQCGPDENELTPAKARSRPHPKAHDESIYHVISEM